MKNSTIPEGGHLLPVDSTHLTRWQSGDTAAQRELRAFFDAVIEGQFDTVFGERAPTESMSVTTSLHLMTLTLMNDLYGLTSAEFYKGDPLRYVRTTLMTQHLLGIRKLTLGWPVYAFGSECLGQIMMYPDGHAPGSDPGEPLVNRANWRDLDTPDLEGEIPRIIEEMLHHFANLTGLDPVAHLPGPYSLAADIFGQEALITALINDPEFVAEFLDHLVDRVFVPWIERLTRHVPKVWIELSDASGSLMFIGPSQFMKIAAPPVRRLINNYPWGSRVFVANYRGDHLMRTAGRGGRRPSTNRRTRRKKMEPQATMESSSNRALLTELIDLKLSLCPQFIIKLEADKLPVSFYVEQAIQHNRPLYLGIGATRIDRHSIGDRILAKEELEEMTKGYVEAIKTVSETLARNGHPRSSIAWPGDIYLEDINAESELTLVKSIVGLVSS